MIQLNISVKEDKIETNYKQNDATLSENSLLVRQLEKIKSELIGRDFEHELNIETINEEDQD